jgi:hypothetical protein
MQLAGCMPGSGASFAAAVLYLSGYNPGSPAQPPTGGVSLTTQPINYIPALQNAFQLAPTQVQQQLCALDGVYVNGGSCAGTDPACFNNAWGYRAFSDKKWYIGIPAGLWSHTQPYTYHQYESDVLQEVYGWNQAWNPYIRPPAYNSANSEADNFDMTVLAALTHELGHVEWYKMMKPANPGDDYDPNKFCAANDGSNFFTWSWAGKVHKAPQWRPFAQRQYQDQHLLPPQISEIDSDLLQGSALTIDSANEDLDELYQSTPVSYPWASYFAALSPDEDFVETYKFYALTNATPIRVILPGGRPITEGPLTSLELRVYYYDGSYTKENVPADYLKSKKPELNAKVKCIINHS